MQFYPPLCNFSQFHVESQPWGWREASKYVPIRFLLRFWPAREHQTMVNQQKFNGPKCDEKFHRQLFRRFGQLFPALKSPLGNLFPQYVVQMVYAEKILGRKIRWEDLPPRSGVGAHGGLLRTKKIKNDYGAQQTSLGARLRLEPSPPTSPTTRLVTSPNQHVRQELSRLPLSNLAVATLPLVPR